MGRWVPRWRSHEENGEADARPDAEDYLCCAIGTPDELAMRVRGVDLEIHDLPFVE